MRMRSTRKIPEKSSHQISKYPMKMRTRKMAKTRTEVQAPHADRRQRQMGKHHNQLQAQREKHLPRSLVKEQLLEDVSTASPIVKRCVLCADINRSPSRRRVRDGDRATFKGNAQELVVLAVSLFILILHTLAIFLSFTKRYYVSITIILDAVLRD